MAYRHVPQPDENCCLGGYCWRKYCPDRTNMRRYMVAECLRRDTLRSHEALGPAAMVDQVDLAEMTDEDRD